MLDEMLLESTALFTGKLLFLILLGVVDIKKWNYCSENLRKKY